MSWFAVMESSARTKGKAKMGRYRNVALVEIEDGHELPRMISPRAIGLVRIVKHWGSCSVGKSDRCQYAIAKREAHEMCDQMNLDRVSGGPTAHGTHIRMSA